MVVKSKFFGRFLMVISAMNVIPRVKVRLSAYTWLKRSVIIHSKFCETGAPDLAASPSAPSRCHPSSFK